MTSIPDFQLAEKISEYNRITIGNQGVAVVDAKGALIQQYKIQSMYQRYMRLSAKARKTA